MTYKILAARLVTAAMVPFLLMSGCAAEGNKPPASAGSTVPLPTTPPTITRPLDASAYRDKPCELLTGEQATVRELTPAPDLRDARTDRSDCYWRGKATARRTPTLRVSYYPEDRLAQIYRRVPLVLQVWDGFVPVTVAGQPAAQTDLPESRGLFCAVDVGLTDNQSVEVVATDFENSCDQVIPIAEMIVHNLGG